MRVSLATAMATAVETGRQMFEEAGQLEPAAFMAWLDLFPTQIVVLGAQVLWSEQVSRFLFLEFLKFKAVLRIRTPIPDPGSPDPGSPDPDLGKTMSAQKSRIFT
jgi:hypothetical protein